MASGRSITGTVTDHQRGSITTGIVIFIFLASFLAALGSIAVLYRDVNYSWVALLQLIHQPSALTPTVPTPSASDPLDVPLQVAADLETQRAELNERLRTPLRAYYATRPEQLKTITVEPAEAPHSTLVTIELHSPEADATHRFFYDRTGKDRRGPYPQWEPGLLDNTP